MDSERIVKEDGLFIEVQIDPNETPENLVLESNEIK
jgi:hypothetical protein